MAVSYDCLQDFQFELKQKVRVDVRDHSNCLVSANLDIGSDNIVLDQPVVQVRIGPGIPNALRSLVVVQAHLVDESCTGLFHLVRGRKLRIGKKVVGSEPCML